MCAAQTRGGVYRCSSSAAVTAIGAAIATRMTVACEITAEVDGSGESERVISCDYRSPSAPATSATSATAAATSADSCGVATATATAAATARAHVNTP